MNGTIDLYSLALTPNDTMYFDSVNAQTNWFNEREHLTVDDISFNGSRAFRLAKNYLDVVFNYNYVRYKLNDRYIYAFIENVTYENDEVCNLEISIDLTQTFLQELQNALVTSNIANITEATSEFNTKYIPYTNKISVPNYKSQRIGDLLAPVQGVNEVGNPAWYYLGFILINIDPLAFRDSTVKPPRLKENGITLPCCCIALPIFYNLGNNQLVTNINCKCDSQGYIYRDICTADDLPAILDKYASYITESCIGITFNQLTIFKNNYTDSNPNLRPVHWDTTDNKFYFHTREVLGPLEISESINFSVSGISKDLLIITKNVTRLQKTFDLASIIDNIPEPLRREPYCYVRIGNDENYITLNLAEFQTLPSLSRNTKLDIEYFNSCCYPFTTNFHFTYGHGSYIDANALFNLTTSTPVPYSTSAWQEYYSQHSASVNDGLATQQKYDREISQNNRNFTQISSTVNTLTQTGTSLLSVVGGGNPISAVGKMINTGVQGTTNIVGASVDYNNSELQRQKEKALLDISWNDIKSSPSSYSNIMSNLTVLYTNDVQGVEIYLYIATNIEDIKKYHNQYGYQVNRTKKIMFPEIKKHTVFDYISFNTITLKSTLPQFYTATLEQQLESGIRFWYNYNNFMNFEIDNTEIEGVQNE